jgi:hypothetical protein
MSSTERLHVSAPACHHQGGFFNNKLMQAQRVNLRIEIHELGLYSYVLEDSLTKEPWCRNM